MADEKAKMTKEAAAKLVVREIPELGKDGKPTGQVKSVPVRPDEVLDCKQYEDRVVVVTTDGRKLTGAKK